MTWRETVDRLGLAGFHFHDLRNTGNTLAASAGASTRELMYRLGHSTVNEKGPGPGSTSLAWALRLERATRIELA